MISYLGKNKNEVKCVYMCVYKTEACLQYLPSREQVKLFFLL